MKPKFLPYDEHTIRDSSGRHTPVQDALAAHSEEIRLLAGMEGNFLSNVASILPRRRDARRQAPFLAMLMTHHGSDEVARVGLRGLQQLAKAGNNVARYNLALKHLAGDVLAPAFGFALSLLAAVAGTEEADPYLKGLAFKVMGECHALGLGFDVNPAEATRLQERAAALGVADAAFNLGLQHDPKGNSDRPADYPTAAKFYKRAADLGHVSAMTNLGALYTTGVVDEPQPHAGWSLLFRAAELGDHVAIEAMTLLAPAGAHAADSSLASVASKRL
jgi:hypothetical protein